VNLVADVSEDGFVAAVQVHGGGGADVDDRGDHARQRRRVGGTDVLVAGDQAGDAVLEAGGKGETRTPVGLSRVADDELVQVYAAVLDLLPPSSRTSRRDGRERRLCRDPADAAFGEQLAGCGHDALPFGPLGPLPAPTGTRPRPTPTSLDKNHEFTHN
jgi:hypothetical protein